jgi:hypothetical protein
MGGGWRLWKKKGILLRVEEEAEWKGRRGGGRGGGGVNFHSKKEHTLTHPRIHHYTQILQTKLLILAQVYFGGRVFSAKLLFVYGCPYFVYLFGYCTFVYDV